MIGNSQKGFAAIYITLVVLALMFGMGSSLFFTTFQEQARMQNDLRSSQAYVGAESGLEDALLRLNEVMNIPSSYVFSVAGSEVSVDVTGGGVGEERTVTVEGDRLNRIRKVEGVYVLSGDASSFFYGAQIGEGGLVTGQNTEVIGNVYSNGPIKGNNGAVIRGSAIVAGDGASGNTIEDIDIGGDAKAPSFKDCTVAGDLTFVTGGEVDNCPAGGSLIEQADPIPPASFPITQSQIDTWKQQAEDGGIISGGDYEPAPRAMVIIGPGVINGDLILMNNQTVILEGTVYVKGNTDIDNGSAIRLASSYGTTSGIMLTDGWLHIKNNGEFQGSGTENSYLMILSLVACRGSGGGDCTDHDAAIDLHNNAEGAVFYAPNGLLHIHNNVAITQATAWKLKLSNNVILRYSLGLGDAFFSSGPSAGWVVSSWKEVE